MCVIPVMIVIALSLFAAGRGEKGRDFAGDYAFGGSTTVEPVVLAAIEEFREIYPGARISYDSQGSSVGIKESCRPIRSAARPAISRSARRRKEPSRRHRLDAGGDREQATVPGTT
jgi:ABC-type phosphate transport system substrate-binding protein